MTHEVPVGGTIAHAYGFAFGNIVNNLGAVWIPAVLLYACNFLLTFVYVRVLLSMGYSLSAIGSSFQLTLIAAVIFGIGSAAQIAGITKEALGLRTGNAWLQFPFGAATLRLIGAYLLYLVVMIVFYAGILMVKFLLAGITASLAGAGDGSKALLAGAGFAAVVLGLFVFCAFVYVAIRLSFLLGPVVVAEHKISLIRAWELTKGNFWRIFVVFLSIFIPMLVLEFAVFWTVFGSSMMLFIHPGATPAEFGALEQQRQQLAESLRHRGFLLFPLEMLAGLIFYSLFAGAAAYAYRAVTASDNSPEMF
jgi:hypothetical protein